MFFPPLNINQLLTVVHLPANLEQVQNVINNLLIAHIEVRTSADIDVRPYIHTTKLEMVKLPLTDEMKAVRALFLELLKIPIEKLNNLNAFWQRDPEKV